EANVRTNPAIQERGGGLRPARVKNPPDHFYKYEDDCAGECGGEKILFDAWLIKRGSKRLASFCTRVKIRTIWEWPPTSSKVSLPDPSFRRGHIRACHSVILLVLSIQLTTACHSHPIWKKQNNDPVPLAEHKLIKKALSKGETHSYSIRLNAGQYLRALVT